MLEARYPRALSTETAVHSYAGRWRFLTLKTATQPVCPVIIAITGTPGTGKSSTCAVLAGRGYAVVDLAEVARREGAVVGRDKARQTDEVDIDLLRARLRVPAKVAFLLGHYSHLLDANLAIVFRCAPSVLRARLEARGWPAEKVRENVEAEALDVITQEAVQHVPFVFEVDTTESTPERAADTVLGILQGKTKGLEPGSVDRSREVPAWY